MAGGVPSSRLNRSSVTSELFNSISRLRRGEALMAGGVPSSRMNRSSVTSELFNSISRLRRGDALMAGGVPSSRLNRSSVTSELLQKPQVVLVEEPDVRRAAAQHRDALDATAEGEALISRGVVANPPQHVGMDHAAARRFD